MTSPRTLVRLTFTLAAMLAAAIAAPAHADRLDAAVTLGGTATGAVGAADDTVTIGFLVNEGVGRKLGFLVKRTKGSKLVPDARLIAPDGTEFNIVTGGGVVTAAATSWKAKLPDVPVAAVPGQNAGLWRLEVRSRDGSTGGFTAKITGKDLAVVSSLSSTIFVNSKLDVPFPAGDATALTILARRAKGQTILPQLQIVDANGIALENGKQFVADAKTGVLSLKGYRLPGFGQYKLRFSGANGSGGTMNYVVKSTPAKAKGALPTAVTPVAAEGEPGFTVELDGHASSVSSGFRWLQVSGPAVSLIGPDTATPHFTAPLLPAGKTSLSLGFQLTVTEAGLLSKAVTVGVELARRPIADAGRSQSVASAATVSLDGSASFRRTEGGLKYAWRQIPGDTAAVTLTGADTATPSFAAPSGVHVLHIGLVVDDGAVHSLDEDVVVVSVGDPAHSVADAGRDQYVHIMSTVHLSGLRTVTPSGVLDGQMLWTQISGTPVTLTAADTPWPSFTAPRRDADLVFEMQTDGGAGASDRVAVHVRATEDNLPPTTRGNGPLNASSGVVSLTATSDDAAARFRWAQIAGPPLAIANDSSATANVTLPAGSEIRLFAAHANDGVQYGAPDVVSVRNASYSGLPLAIAGGDPNPVGPGISVRLDGRGSVHTDGTTGPLTYQWTQVSGKDWFDVAANVASFDPTVAFPGFAIPTDVSSLTPKRSLLFQLVVGDGVNTSLPDLVAVRLENLPTNGKPLVSAAASELNPIAGGSVQLTATTSDRDGDPVTVLWTQTSGPTTNLSPNATSLTPTLIAPAQGILRYQVVANDGFDNSTAASVTITVNAKPTASIIVSPKSGPPGTQVTMDGSASSDPDGDPLTYQWTQTAGATVAGLNLTASALSFTAPTGAVSFRLVVNDGRQSSDPKSDGFSGNLPPTTSASVSGVDTTVMPTLTGTSGNYATYGGNVTLSANATGTGTLSYTWRIVSQSPSSTTMPITLSATNSANPSFTVPLPSSGPFGTSPQATFGVTATDGIQTSSETTVTVRFFASLYNGTNSQSTNNVYGIISTRCTSCHGGTGAGSCPVGVSGSGYPIGTKNVFLSNSRGHSSCGSASKSRLPASPNTGQSTTNAYLWDRISGSSGGQQMPQGSALSAQDQNLIRDWIDQGVFDN